MSRHFPEMWLQAEGAPASPYSHKWRNERFSIRWECQKPAMARFVSCGDSLAACLTAISSAAEVLYVNAPPLQGFQSSPAAIQRWSRPLPRHIFQRAFPAAWRSRIRRSGSQRRAAMSEGSPCPALPCPALPCPVPPRGRSSCPEINYCEGVNVAASLEENLSQAERDKPLPLDR